MDLARRTVYKRSSESSYCSEGTSPLTWRNPASTVTSNMLVSLRFRATVPLSKCRTFASLAQTRWLSSTPIVINPSKPETTNGALESRNLEKAVSAIHRDGLVVVENVFPHDILDHLNKKMVEDARTLQARGEDGPFNYNLGNLQLDAPPIAEYFNPAIFARMYSPSVATHISPVSGYCPSHLADANSRSDRHADHLGGAWSPSQMDVLLRQCGQ